MEQPISGGPKRKDAGDKKGNEASEASANEEKLTPRELERKRIREKRRAEKRAAREKAKVKAKSKAKTNHATNEIEPGDL